MGKRIIPAPTQSGTAAIDAVAGNIPVFGPEPGSLFVDSGVALSLLVENAHQLLVGAPTAALGSTFSDAAGLPAATGGTYIVTGADGTKGVRIDAADAVITRCLVIGNSSANVLKIYPNTGGTMNGGAANAPFVTAACKGSLVVCTATNAWHAI